MAEHKYAQVLRWIADCERIQVKYHVNGWCDESYSDALGKVVAGTVEPERFRLAPRTIIVNGVEVPAPEKDAPKEKTSIYIVDIYSDRYVYESTWGESMEMHKSLLRNGLLYLKKEDAIARAKAMLITKEV